MRIVSSAALVLAFAFACHRSPEAPAATVDDPPTEPAEAGAADDGGESGDDDTASVTGTVVTEAGAPVVGRSVILVDGDGERHPVTTDQDGAFRVTGVSLPYDVAVAGAGSDPPSVYLGLDRSDPYFELFEPGAALDGPQTQIVRVGVRAPACVPDADGGAPASACSVTVVTASPSGGGTSTVPCVSGPRWAPLAVDVSHLWHASLAAFEAIDVNVLVSCHPTSDPAADRVSFAYGAVRGVRAVPGITTDIGMADAVPALPLPPVAVGVRQGAEALAPWTWTTEVALDLAAGGPIDGGFAAISGPFLFAASASSTMSLRLPLLRSANLRVLVSANHPRSDSGGGFSRSAQAWSGDEPLVRLEPVPIVGVDVAAGPDLLKPDVGGKLSLAETITWQGGGPGLATLSVVDTEHGTGSFHVLTEDPDVALQRLVDLGVPAMHPGGHALDLTTHPMGSLDDATSSDPAVRHRRFDLSRPGAATYLRAPFTVVE